MYRSVYVDLEGMLFHDLESLNVAILKSLEKFNARNLTRRRESRRQLFDSIERDSLRPLPPDRYQMRQRTVATVQRNSYVTLNKHHYSVPVQYVGKRVEMVYDTDTIDIFHGFTHVATHHRNDTPYEYTTKPSHNLPGRKGSCESDLQELLSRAAVIDNIVVHYLRAVIEDKRYPELAFRTCRGIMNLEKSTGRNALYPDAPRPWTHAATASATWWTSLIPELTRIICREPRPMTGNPGGRPTVTYEAKNTLPPA